MRINRLQQKKEISSVFWIFLKILHRPKTAVACYKLTYYWVLR